MNEKVVGFLVTIILIAVCFYILYFVGGDSIIFFRRKKVQDDKTAPEKMLPTLRRTATLRGYKLLTNIHLYYKGEGTHFDAVLVGAFGVLVINASGLGGEVYGTAEEETWLQVFNEEHYRIENPLEQNSKKVRILRGILSDSRVKVKIIDPLLVFTQPKVDLNISTALPYVRLKNLSNFFDKARYIEDKQADVEAVVAALENNKQ